MTLAANVVVAFESLVGLLGFAIIAGIVFARFARPMAQIVVQRRSAIIAPYRGKTALMFRIVNQKRERDRGAGGEGAAGAAQARRRRRDREFIPLKLERERVVFFPLAWTIVHPIDETSPLTRLDRATTCASSTPSS